MCTHLAKRGSVYYYRRKTPIELISTYGKEIMKSLGTKDRKQAEVLVRKLGTHYDELFAKALTQATASHVEPLETPTHQPESTHLKWDHGLTVDDAELYAAMFLKKLRASRERAVAEGTLREFNSAMNNLIGGHKEYIKTGLHPFEDKPKELWKIEAQVIAAKALKKNKHLSIEGSPLSHSHSTVKPTPSVSGVYIDTVLDKWSTARQPTVRTIAMTKSIVNKFNSCVAPKPIRDITKQDVVFFKDQLLSENFSTANTRKYLRMISTLLNFAIGEAMLDLNPALGVTIKDKKLAKEKRLPFDLESLNKIFSCPIYTNAERPTGGKGEASYWIPLIALFTGARLNEICQLSTRDLIKVDYVNSDNLAQEAWIINITNEGDGQTIKNEGSKRRVPVHKELVRLGLINYLNSLPKGGRLFPELTAAKTYESISANWSKWFNRYLRDVIRVSDTRMVFHSFRHCFKDHARNSGIATEVHHAITGHSSGNVGDNYGGDVYPLRPLVEAMDKYQVQGLALR